MHICAFKLLYISALYPHDHRYHDRFTIDLIGEEGFDFFFDDLDEIFLLDIRHILHGLRI